MPIISIVNPKGGVGKTTLATNLAGYFANQGHRTLLGDYDVQQSSRSWLGLRAPALARIETWDEPAGEPVRKPPRGVKHVVLDTPAQIDDARVAELVRASHRLVVPLMPGIFDVFATHAFLEALQGHYGGSARMARRVAVVAMRVDTRTLAARQLERFVERLGLPVAAYIRDTQNYVHVAAHGMSIFDVPSRQLDVDRQSWQALLEWIEG